MLGTRPLVPLKWSTGYGLKKMTIERVHREDDRLCPIIATSMGFADAMDVNNTLLMLFKRVGMDYVTFKNMCREFGEVVMHVMWCKTSAVPCPMLNKDFDGSVDEPLGQVVSEMGPSSRSTAKAWHVCIWPLLSAESTLIWATQQWVGGGIQHQC